MTEFYRVRNFERFQHYTDRRPPWIKIYRDLWDDPRFFSLSERDRYVLISLFVVASQQDNKIPNNQQWLKAKLMTKAAIPLEKLAATGWLEAVEQDASKPLAASTTLADCYPSRARGETETEVQRQNTETETEREREEKSPSRTSYGEFNQVLLGDEEYDKLETKLGERSFTEYLSRLDRYSQTHPSEFRKYKSHYAVILSWADRDKQNGGIRPNGKTKADRNREAAERLRARFDS